MKAILQRVSEASVWVDSKEVSHINQGWLILLGICHSDQESHISYLVKKILSLRAFCDEEEKMNLSIKDVGGSILLVSQFTLYGRCDKGARPSFVEAARPEHAKPLYQKLAERLREHGVTVETGVFGAKMDIRMRGDGPVTLTLESK